MKAYWESNNLVETSTDQNVLSKFAVSSTPEEWARSGVARKLFDQGRYSEAARAFERGNQYREAAVAKAYQLRVQARQKHGKHKEQREAYLAAAAAFIECAQVALLSTERRLYYRIAAECYVIVKMHKQAAKAFFEAGMYDLAAIHYVDGNLLDNAVAIIEQYPIEDIRLAERVRNLARFTYLKEHRHSDVEKVFHSHEELAEFAVDHDLENAHAAFVESKQSYFKAAELYLQEGQKFKAAELFMKDKENPESAIRAKDSLFDLLWSNMSFGISTFSSDAQSTIEDVLGMMHLVRSRTKAFSSSDRTTMDMFEAIYIADWPQLRSLALSLREAHCMDPRVILSLDHLFDDDDLSQIERDTDEQLISSLQLFTQYVNEMRKIIEHPTPWTSSTVQRVFNVSKSDDDHVRLHPGTALRSQHAQGNSDLAIQNGELYLSNTEFLNCLRSYLSSRLHQRIVDENELMKRVRVTDPCFKVLLSGQCRKPGCTLVHKLDDSWYARRVRFRLQQIIILDALQELPKPFGSVREERLEQRRSWLDRLDDALGTLMFKMPTIASLDVTQIPEAPIAFLVVKRWTSETLFDLRPALPNSRFGFLTNFAKASFLGMFIDREMVFSHFDRIPCLQWLGRWHPQLTIWRAPQECSTNVLWSWIDFLRGASDRRDFLLGASFLQYVVQHRVPINLGLLCRMVQRLCTLFSMAYNYQQRRSMHNVILPRSWVLELWQDFNNVKEKPCRSFKMLVDPIRELMLQLHTVEPVVDSRGLTINDWLHYASRDLPWPVVSDASIASLCQSLSLLGLNIRDDGLRSGIVNAIASVVYHGSDRHPQGPPDSYRPYFAARRWSDLAHAVQSDSTSSFNKLIRFHSDAVAQPLVELPGLHRLVYNRLDDIPNLLDPGHQFQRLKEIVKPFTGNASVSAAGTTVPNTAHIKIENDSSADSAAHPIKEDDTVDVDIDADEPPYAHFAANRATGISDSQEQAARRIQKAARQMLRRMKARPQNGRAAALQRLFRTCKAESEHLAKVSYRAIYLGPLPHLLLCLEWMLNKLKEVKAHAKRKSDQLNLQELTEAMERQTRMNAIRKKVEQYRELVEATSSFHKRCDTNELRRVASEVYALMTSDEFDLPESEQIGGDLKIVWKGIVKEKVSRRPFLNTEDL
ncbi:hypothetical protein EVG20_g4858 [Dentipellis fragilis]|uniref:Uncharacterized protein n=1 Tax=Dentipellis fragilis TaxID=205917 RepID=A0A4Y9YXD8_9AGAM|nr:hypothetical protein EVG20_g4858 [Dentipellis fragilis]